MCYLYRPPLLRHVHPFPTRRSSDLAVGRARDVLGVSHGELPTVRQFDQEGTERLGPNHRPDLEVGSHHFDPSTRLRNSSTSAHLRTALTVPLRRSATVRQQIDCTTF